jgi:hypothetical protein
MRVLIVAGIFSFAFSADSGANEPKPENVFSKTQMDRFAVTHDIYNGRRDRLLQVSARPCSGRFAFPHISKTSCTGCGRRTTPITSNHVLVHETVLDADENVSKQSRSIVEVD